MLLCVMLLCTGVLADELYIDTMGSLFGEAEESANTQQTESAENTPQNTVDGSLQQNDVQSENAASDDTQQSSTQQTGEETTTISFPDVPEDSSYAEAVAKLVESGVLNGYEDGTFRPENGVTRAELCKMINLTFGYTDTLDAAGFPDVYETDWFMPYALAAQKAGYVEGYEDGSFRGANNITRQEVCAIVNRILKPWDLGIEVNITDEVSDWAKEHVEIIVMNQLMPLEENNTFRATEIIKRYELATLLANFIVEPAEPLTAEIKFFVNGTQLGETDVVLIGDNATVPENPAAPDESYVFDGWRVVGTQDAVDVSSITVTGNVDYEAVFVKKTFSVEFYNDGSLYETQTVEYGKTPTVPLNEPEKSGFEFLGWAFIEDGDTEKIEEILVYENIILYAVFEKESSGGGGSGTGGGGTSTKEYYNVFFFVNDELYVTQEVVENGNPGEPDEPYAEGYVFHGWALKENGDEDDIVDVEDYKVTGPTDFYAVLTENPNDPEVIEMLERGIEQLNDIRMTTEVHKTLRTMIINCMTLVLNDAKSGIFVDQEYVGDTYDDEITAVENFVYDDMTTRQATDFKNMVTNPDNVDEDVQDFLDEYFLSGVEIDV